MKIIKSHKTFDGITSFWSHYSHVTKTNMNFSTFIPSNKNITKCIIWLSGLTCNEENFITKSSVQRILNNQDVMIICPDTSPRGLNLENENKSYDFGSGAGFYVNATTKEYKNHYRMFDYISLELYNIIINYFFNSVNGNISIMGHSMGGHGALVIGLNYPDKFKAISAFAPITNPINTNLGKKCFTGYLGKDIESWKKYDACELIKASKKHDKKILIDQGSDDNFLNTSLLPNRLITICKEYKQKLELNFREGYDHSYYFVSTFIESHINFHLNYL